MVDINAGEGIGSDDDVYRSAGAEVVESAAEVFERADMIVKVKEPQASERAMLREGQLLFTYLHDYDPEQTEDLIDSGAVCVAYETVTSPRGGLPLLAPMSKVAGRMSKLAPIALNIHMVVLVCCSAVFQVWTRRRSLFLGGVWLEPTRLTSPWEWVQTFGLSIRTLTR